MISLIISLFLGGINSFGLPIFSCRDMLTPAVLQFSEPIYIRRGRGTERTADIKVDNHLVSVFSWNVEQQTELFESGGVVWEGAISLRTIKRFFDSVYEGRVEGAEVYQEMHLRTTDRIRFGLRPINQILGWEVYRWFVRRWTSVSPLYRHFMRPTYFTARVTSDVPGIESISVWTRLVEDQRIRVGVHFRPAALKDEQFIRAFEQLVRASRPFADRAVNRAQKESMVRSFIQHTKEFFSE